MKCPNCNSEYIEGYDIHCPSCQFPLQYASPEYQELIDWLNKRQMENDQYSEISDKKESPSFSKAHFNELQNSQSNNTERIYNLEQLVKEELVNDYESLKKYLEKSTERLNQNIDTVTGIYKIIEEYEKENSKTQDNLLEINNKLVTFEEERAQIQQQLNQVPELLTRLEQLEKYLKAKSYSNTPKNLSSEQEKNIVKTTPTMTSSDRELSWEEHQLVEQYNNQKETLVNCNTVSETKQSSEDRRLGKSKTVILEKERRGNYWIVEKEGMTYLIPSDNLRVNEYNYKTVEAVFECRGYQPNISSNFKLLQPAIVTETDEENNWKLEKPGILEF
ncbi:MAG: hypothetical protein QNJ33_05455 [Crocosphaera sp.]|nr:hypothetical protein [Crocosphaera sp.]